MKCEDAMERIHDRLTGDLDAPALEELREHLAGCSGCAAEARALQSLWDGLAHEGSGWRGLGGSAAETPTATLRQRFDRMLARAVAEEGATTTARAASGGVAAAGTPDTEAFARARARRHGNERSVFRAALSLAIAAGLALALGAGVFIGSNSASRQGAEDLAEMRDEIRSLRSTVALALLAEPSASERLNGVAYGRELQTQDRRVADALFTTLLEDPNVNVRLAALDALREVSSQPETRARLLESIPAQDSPLVQISAIDVLLEAAAPTASSAELARLTENPDLDEVVRGYLRDRLERSPR